ncbi:MAG: hypothetical protein RIT45_1126 [Pseudomonadota bacterium]
MTHELTGEPVETGQTTHRLAPHHRRHSVGRDGQNGAGRQPELFLPQGARYTPAHDAGDPLDGGTRAEKARSDIADTAKGRQPATSARSKDTSHDRGATTAHSLLVKPAHDRARPPIPMLPVETRYCVDFACCQSTVSERIDHEYQTLSDTLDNPCSITAVTLAGKGTGSDPEPNRHLNAPGASEVGARPAR